MSDRRRGASCVLALLAWLTVPPEAIAEAGPLLGARLELVGLARTGDSEIRECVGTWIAADWLMTAAHCLPAAIHELRVALASDHGPAEVLVPRALVPHPTHDIALIRASPSRSRPVACLGRIDGQKRYAAPRLPRRRAEDASATGPLSLRETARDDHVLQLHSASDCMDRGDSGSPVFRMSGTGEWLLVAITITGSRDCPSHDMALRLDTVLPWILEQVAADPDREASGCTSAAGLVLN